MASGRFPGPGGTAVDFLEPTEMVWSRSDITRLSWTKVMGILSSRPPAPAAQLVGPSEQFATVGGAEVPPPHPHLHGKQRAVWTQINSGPTEREESSLDQHSVQFIRLSGAKQVYRPEQKWEKRHLKSIKTRPGDKHMTSFWRPLISR